MADATYPVSGTGVYREQGGNRLVVGSTGQITGATSDNLVINSTGITIGSTGRLGIQAGGLITLPVTTGSTTVDVSNCGLTAITATSGGGAQVFNIADPVAGVLKTIVCLVANSTDTATLKASTTVSFDNATKNRYRFVAEGAVHMVGVSATRWAVTSVSTAIAFATS